MPLRDHFHLPLSNDTPWSVFRGLLSPSRDAISSCCV